MAIVRYLLFFSALIHATQLTLPVSFQADFIQTVTGVKGKTLHYEGKLYFSQPGRVRWVYLKPEAKEVCTQGKRMTVVEKELEQVTLYRLKKHLALSDILRRAKPVKPHIYDALYEGRHYTLRTDESGNVDSIAFFDELDNKVQILFKKIKRGTKPLPESATACRYPKSYDIIKG